MRQKLKLILFAALSAALTVAGLSMAAGGGSSDSGNKNQGTREVHEAFGGAPGMGTFDPNVGDVMRQIHDAVEKKAPEVADPIIQKAQDAGDITSSQADQLRALVKDMAAEKPPTPSGDPRALFGDSHVRAVLQSIFQARAREAVAIGEPIIQKAVDGKKITSAQAAEIRTHLKTPPSFAFGHGPGRERHFFGHFDQDVGNVMGDIHRAVEQKAPEIADPIIRKAQDAGDITSAQADKLRAAARDIASGNHPGPPDATLLGDAKVRKVVQDAFAAAAKQAPAIAEPIIQKAVDGKKITSAQAADIRNKLKSIESFRGGPPHFGGPGGPDKEGFRGLQPPRRVAPGALPGGFAPGAPPAEQVSPNARPA